MSVNQKPKRILIVEDAPEIRRIMEYALQSGEYELTCLENGMQALEKLKSFQPDLIILDIMMPGIHGLEVLKQLKANPETQHIGVIICSGKQYKSDVEHAMNLGAADYLTKPFDMDQLAVKVKTFFSMQQLRSLASAQPVVVPEHEMFLPMLNPSQCYLKFWGCRGSVPVAGRQYMRYGGNTPCLEINCGDELIIIDAGTGIRELGMHVLQQKIKRIHLFIGHTHWDHIQGFPFFTPAYTENQEVLIYGAAGYGRDLKSAFSGQLASEYFPVQLEDMKAKLTFVELESNPICVGKVKIYWEYVHHPGAALGFKISINGKSIVYITDNEFLQGYLGAPHNITLEDTILHSYHSFISFISNADILIYEAQYPNDEYKHKIGWGHTSLSNACLLAKLGNVKRWIITHHDPMHDDQFLDKKLLLTRQILESLNYPIEVCHAYDGMMELI